MNLPEFNAHEVAKALEFSGFGPAVATGDLTLQVGINKEELEAPMLFNLTLNKDGALGGFDVAWKYQNALHPVVRAVLNIVSHVFIGFGEFEFFEGVITEDFDTKHFESRSTYLWCLENEDPEIRERLVLNEFFIRGEPVWHSLNVTDYDNLTYINYYADIRDMITDFKEHGTLPEGISPRQLDVCVSRCHPATTKEG